MRAVTVELIMSEFGDQRQNCGGAELDAYDRLNPTLDGIRKLFPDIKVTLYVDFNYNTDHSNINIIQVKPPFDNKHNRYGWRAHDYYQIYGLLESKADIAIAMDSDMMIVSDNFKVIIPIAETFGFCVPANPRLQVAVDGNIGADSCYNSEKDISKGQGFAYNLTPIAFATNNEKARIFLKNYAARMLENQGRAAINMYEAAFDTKFNPYLLPFQWCVCSPKDLDSKHIWKNAIALHIGHKDVYPYYLQQQKKHLRKMFLKSLKQKIRGK